MKMIYRVYTYDSYGNDQIILIEAHSEAHALSEFRARYGKRTVDFIKPLDN